eukprot:660443-Amorphochlora_amoeboformis.AAC.2
MPPTPTACPDCRITAKFASSRLHSAHKLFLGCGAEVSTPHRGQRARFGWCIKFACVNDGGGELGGHGRCSD